MTETPICDDEYNAYRAMEGCAKACGVRLSNPLTSEQCACMASDCADEFADCEATAALEAACGPLSGTTGDESSTTGTTGGMSGDESTSAGTTGGTLGDESTSAGTTGGMLAACAPAQADFDRLSDAAECAIDLDAQTCACSTGAAALGDVVGVVYVADGTHWGHANGFAITAISAGDFEMGVAGYSLMSNMPSDTPITITMTHIVTSQDLVAEITIGSDRTLGMSTDFP